MGKEDVFEKEKSCVRLKGILSKLLLNFYVHQLKRKFICISKTALMFKILLNIFYLCYTPNVNEGHESGRFMIDMIGFSDMKRPHI